MMSNRSPANDDQIDLRRFVKIFTDQKLFISAFTSVGAVISIGIAILTTPIYRAEVLLAQVEEDRGGALSAIANQFGDLASLAGITLGRTVGKAEGIAVLKSRALGEQFIREEKLMPAILGRGDEAIFKGEVATDKPGRDSKRVLWDAYRSFDLGIRVVGEDRKTGLITLAMEWKDPEVAVLWANRYVKLANENMRQRAISQSTKGVEYLQRELAKTNSIEAQQAIYRLIESQTKTIAVAHAREDYAFRIVDPAAAPVERIRPKRFLTVVLGALSSLLAAIVLAPLIMLYRRRAELF